MKIRSALALLAVTALAPWPHTSAQQPPAIESVVNALTFRNIGPFRTAAWVTEVAVPEAPARDHLYTIYAATRSGGLWKTTNAGTTWTRDLGQRRRRGGRRRRARALESQHRVDGHRRPGERAVVVLGQGRLQVDRRRRDLAVHGPARLAPHRPHRHSPDETRTSSTSRRWGTSSRGTKSAACSGRSTAARRGRRCSTSTTASARSIS